MPLDQPGGVTRRYYVYRAIVSLSLWAPVWVLYLQRRRGLSLAEVTVLDAVFWAGIALSEIPTGAVADTFGRKTSMALGTALSAGAMLVFGLASTYELLLVSYMLWA